MILYNKIQNLNKLVTFKIHLFCMENNKFIVFRLIIVNQFAVTVCDRSRQTESENERYMSFHRSFSFAIDTYMMKTFHYRFLPLAAIPVLLF